MSEQPLFSFQSVALHLAQKHILDDITFDVMQGDFLSVLGASGAGKSSLLRLFNHLQSPTGGKIFYRGKTLDTDVQVLRRNVGFLFQSPAIFNGSIRENLLIAGRWDNSIAQILDHELKEVLKKVELVDVELGKNARDLSGGEKQRLALARTLLNQPQVLLLDEPTSSLDPHMSISIMDLVKKLQNDLKLTVIAVSHNHLLMRKYARKVILLDKGRILSMGTFKDLDQQKAFDQVGLTSPEQADAS